MFSGIVQALGTVTRCETRGSDLRLEIATGMLDLTDVVVGDSVCVSGVCLTAVELGAAGFVADVSVATLALTTLGALRADAPVNLEKALRLSDRLGGHLVSGHVDGVGRVVGVDAGMAGSQRWRFELPAALSRYVAVKGSICVDGVSLTVNEVDANHFGVTLIPHTLASTTFARRAAGDAVNLEVDLIARYLERLHVDGS